MRGERGAIAVEFAIILPVLMFLVFGIIDFGHAW
jgi:Flp pilus assembly protein TadG